MKAVVAEDEALLREELLSLLREAWPGLESSAALATSSPVRPGMRMSRNATSGLCSAIASSASPPSSHSATTWRSGHTSRSRESSSARSSGSSSAMTAFMA